MPEIIYFSTLFLDDELRFEIQIFDHGGKIWIRFNSVNDLSINRFWSLDSDVANAISYSSLIEELQKRIKAVRTEKFDIWNALEFWPQGWVYWGGGTPVPIEDYLKDDEYNQQLRYYRERNCLE